MRRRDPMERLTDAALIAGATARITHLITHDDVPGQWWIKDPLNNLAFQKSFEKGSDVWWRRYLDGLDCPHCIGQWVAFGVVGSYAIAGHTRAWRLVAGALTANAAAVALGGLADYWERPEE